MTLLKGLPFWIHFSSWWLILSCCPFESRQSRLELEKSKGVSSTRQVSNRRCYFSIAHYSATTRSSGLWISPLSILLYSAYAHMMRLRPSSYNRIMSVMSKKISLRSCASAPSYRPRSRTSYQSSKLTSNLRNLDAAVTLVSSVSGANWEPNLPPSFSLASSERWITGAQLSLKRCRHAEFSSITTVW